MTQKKSGCVLVSEGFHCTRIIFCCFWYYSVAQIFPSTTYGQGSGPVVATSIKCTGREQNISECDISSNLFASHFYDMGVKCFKEEG